MILNNDGGDNDKEDDDDTANDWVQLVGKEKLCYMLTVKSILPLDTHCSCLWVFPTDANHELHPDGTIIYC